MAEDIAVFQMKLICLFNKKGQKGIEHCEVGPRPVVSVEFDGLGFQLSHLLRILVNQVGLLVIGFLQGLQRLGLFFKFKELFPLNSFKLGFSLLQFLQDSRLLASGFHQLDLQLSNFTVGAQI